MPWAKFTLFLADKVDGRFSSEDLGFEVVEMTELPCPNLFDMAARYTIMELNTAIKPFCLRYLLDQPGTTTAIYLDPDIMVVAAFDELLEVLRRPDVDIVLTPHSLTPLDDGKNPDDHQLMRAGAYNLGFCAVNKTSNTLRFITWWETQLEAHCIVDVPNGIFVDQKFCDLVPCYFDNVHILRHAGYNVAYWNLLGRVVARDEATRVWTANEVPLRFFHFSGVIPGNYSIFSKHQDRYTVENIGDVRGLLEEYLTKLDQFAGVGGTKFASMPYAFGALSDGTPITDAMRLVYRESHVAAPREYAEVFAADLGRFLTYAPGIGGNTTTPVTRLMHAVWKSRDDLRTAFHNGTEDGRRGFANWFMHTKEHKLPAKVVEATQAALEISQVLPSAGNEDSSPLPPGSHILGNWSHPHNLNRELERGLAMFGRFRAETGLGAAVRSNFRAAKNAGVKVSAHDIRGYKPRVALDFQLEQTAPVYDCILFHMNADETAQIETLIDPRLLRGRHRIGYWAWELDRLPIEWLDAYGKVDEIWCPSVFTAEAVAPRTSKPVKVVPHPVAVPVRPREAGEVFRQKLGLGEHTTVFLSAFDVNSYIDRKNPGAVVRCFKKAFEARDDVCLLLKMHGKNLRNHRFDEFLRLVGSDARNQDRGCNACRRRG